MLEAQIVKARREFTVDVTLALARGERLALFGASGAGKSTVLSCVAGLEQPDRGWIRWDDEVLYPPPLALHQRPLAYLTQKDLLFPHLTVGENVCFGLASATNGNGTVNGTVNGKHHHNGDGHGLTNGNGSSLATDWVGHLREQLGLTPLWHVSARKISGGQARRVAIARMLARRPPLLLLDEPFVALDRPLIRELIENLLAWQATLGFALIVVDHRPEVLTRLCTRVAVIERGRIVQDAPWSAVTAAPATPLLASLLAPH